MERVLLKQSRDDNLELFSLLPGVYREEGGPLLRAYLNVAQGLLDASSARLSEAMLDRLAARAVPPKARRERLLAPVDLQPAASPQADLCGVWAGVLVRSPAKGKLEVVESARPACVLVWVGPRTGPLEEPEAHRLPAGTRLQGVRVEKAPSWKRPIPGRSFRGEVLWDVSAAGGAGVDRA